MIDYEEDWVFVLLCRTAGSASGRACCFAIPATVFTIGLLFMDDYAQELRKEYEFLDYHQGTIWSAVTAIMLVLIGFRTRNAYGRFWEGTGLLHQMRGEWFDTVSNCITFSIKGKEKKPEEVMKFRHTLVRLMSLAHGNALEEISDNQFELDTIDAHGLDVGTLRHLKDCHERCKFNKVEVLLHLIQSLITSAHMNGLLDIPPPILSRVFQTISRGFVNLLNSKKITDTKFPFPYVQLIATLLVAFTFVTPLVLSSFITNKIIASIVTFIPVFGVASLNAIAQELENPFGMDDNDLPIAHFQEEMDRCLLMLLHPNADIIATTSPNVEMDFNKLLRSFENADVDNSLRVSNIASPPDSPKHDQEKRKGKAKITEADVEEVSNSTPINTPTKGSSPWTKPGKQSVVSNAARKVKRLDSETLAAKSSADAEALAFEEQSLQQSTPSNTPTPKNTPAAVWKGAAAVRETSERGASALAPTTSEVVVKCSEKDPFPDEKCSDQRSLNADLKVFLQTSICTFVKSLEAMTNMLQHQVDVLNQASDIINDPSGKSVQAPAFPPKDRTLSVARDPQVQTGSGLSQIESMSKKWENMVNKRPPTWHPATDAKMSSK